ncbi:MAG: nucleotidyltransferase family protein, partial [Methanothrix sp.]|nr:nucleotidyltransferase family protein [Methanothrix sp.]
VNTHYDRGMFSSIQTGVRHFEGRCRAFFLHPADIPFVASDTLKTLIGAFQTGEMDIYRPCYGGKHGHPPLISAALIKEILEFNGGGGMRALLARYAKKTRNIDCDDPGILTDIDTPDDYRKALESFPSGFNEIWRRSE